jgi:transcriptional regulator with XRE-family HTH domain
MYKVFNRWEEYKVNELGSFLRKLRGKMTFREAAERSGLSHAYIRYLEIGKRPGTNTPINPSPEMLKGLSKAYNHSYKDLMVRAGYSYDDNAQSSIEETELDEEGKRLANIIVNIKDPEKKKQAIAYLEYLANSPTDGVKK